ncbi:SIR2 family protein [Gardnerella swidsinskii]|uniref:SIR2 family protein n=1 Tax=Gardnerella swidsinskii TaxID=2792979 RepID=UPI0039EFA5C4
MVNDIVFEDSNKKDKEELLDCLMKERGLFFTGSGISIESGVAKVDDVLQHTCDKFLMEFDKCGWCVPQKEMSRKDYICKIVQPELFYSVLLECTGDDRVLEMWNCLKKDHFTKDYEPQPNIIHYFIVAYSYFAKVPIFTMNYDKMFESSCEKLRLPHLVYVDCPTDESLESQVVICKLHGNLRENSGNIVTKDDIATTMPGISKKSDFADYVKSNIKTHDVCIWGYSGRDVDYFPILRNSHYEDRKFFWTVGNPKESEIDKLTEENASSLHNVVKITGYPSNMKDELMNVLSTFDGGSDIVDHIRELTKDSSVSTEEKEKFLKEIESNIDAKNISFNKEIFWMLLLQRTGQNKDLKCMIEKLSEKYDDDDCNSLTSKERIILLKARISLARESADFDKYRQLAKELKKTAKKYGLSSIDRRQYLADSKIEYVSSLQMRVPSSLSLKVPLLRRKYGLLLLVRIRFALVNSMFIRDEELYKSNEVIAQECELRSLAIDCKIPFLNKRAKRKLRSLLARAKAIGNHATIIGACKYLYRLYSYNNDKYAQMVKDAGTIGSDLSALSIIYRDEDVNKSLEEAKKNDNTLNIVKAIFKKKSLINDCTDLTISDEEKELLFNSIKKITPKSLKKTLLRIGKREGLFLKNSK